MGGTRWSDDSYKNLTSYYSTKTIDQVFSSKSIDDLMNPKGLKFRESRDSAVHPESVAIMVMLDVTGSMGKIPEILIKQKLGALMHTLIDHGVPDAHVLFGAIGDHYCDQFPIQVGQFEAGTEELNQWLTKICLEGGGGGQNRESYHLGWLIGGRHTSIDCFEKRGQKGFLFTIGDEGVHDALEGDFIKQHLDDTSEKLSAKQLLSEAQRLYHVFHLHIKQGSAGSDQQVIDQWHQLLGENVIHVNDYNNIAEIIATTVAVMRGADIKTVTSSFDKSVANNVSTALAKVSADISVNKKKGLFKFF